MHVRIQSSHTFKNGARETGNVAQHVTFWPLRLIVDAPWYVSNYVIRKDLQIPTVKEEISRFSSIYAVRLRAHTNELIATLTEPKQNKSVCADIGPTTCLPDSSLFLYL
jgi:hypothetical protein